MSDKSDTKILQVLGRQPRQDRVVDLILAEGRLILFEAKLPQPTSDVHGGTLVRLPLHDPPGETACLGRGSNDRFGSNSEVGARNRHVGFPPDSDKTADIAGGPFRANSGLM